MSEEHGQGQRMRWWQESETSAAAQDIQRIQSHTVEAVVLESQPAIRDIGEELEEEARLRAEQAKVTERESLVIAAQPGQSIRRLRRRMFGIMLPIVAAYSAFIYGLALLAHAPFPSFLYALPLLLFAEVFVLYTIMSRVHRRQKKPIVILTPEGIEVHTALQDIGLIRWEEIAEIRAYTFSLYRFVGIVPKDVKALAERIGPKRARILLWNESSIRWFYKPFRVFVAPINIPQEQLPISADALVTRIAAYESNRWEG